MIQKNKKQKHILLHRESIGSFICRQVLRIILYIWALLILLPLIWTIYSSVKTPREFMNSVWALPDVVYLVNYQKAWIKADMAQNTMNTLIISGISVALYFIMVSATSYILGKYSFRWKKILYGFYFAAMMIPSILMLVPLYFQLESVKPGFTDNIFVLAVVYAVQAIPRAVFLLTGFIENIDNSFIEAARIDGASEFSIYSRIIIPFEKPILMFLCLTTFMADWNEYTMARTFLKSSSHYTISIGLQKMTRIFSYGNEHGAVFAGMVISMIPILVLYSIFQKQILEGIDAGGGIK